MECCCLNCFLTSQERHNKEISRQIDESIQRSKQQEKTRIKLLLLGTGESGKSTFIRQMRIIYGEGFTDDEKRNYMKLIMQNILTALQTMVEAMSYFNIDYELQSNRRNATLIRTADFDTFYRLIDMYVKAIEELWRDTGIQECYMRRSEYQLVDSIKYYLENIDRISSPSYIPTEDDILHVRAATTGLVEYTFKVKNVEFRMVDVGGQRSERKKWLNCFDDVKAIIFLTAISEYDQTLSEADSLNRLEESINVFKSISSYKWFDGTSIVLFFNKIDLLREKIMYSDLNKYFPAFQGRRHDYDEAKDFIYKLFIGVNPKRRLYTHFTCATDTENIKVVFDAVRDTILSARLNRFGLF
ncbi:guanine nucleotide-binding protein subunit alpha-14-like [Haematobia irritans]|uniref:guanine nucleotide-binding protein subunit alpha-14-like n=1 Tax=Haematobia irritans TaxID=7368 RepID=UPI003F5086DC